MFEGFAGVVGEWRERRAPSESKMLGAIVSGAVVDGWSTEGFARSAAREWLVKVEGGSEKSRCTVGAGDEDSWVASPARVDGGGETGSTNDGAGTTDGGV